MKTEVKKLLTSLFIFACASFAFADEIAEISANNDRNYNQTSDIKSSAEYFNALDGELSLSRNINYINFSFDEMRIIAAVTQRMNQVDQIKIINKYDDYYLNIKDMSEERVILLFPLLAKYLSDHISWPFEREYDDVLINLM